MTTHIVINLETNWFFNFITVDKEYNEVMRIVKMAEQEIFQPISLKKEKINLY